MEPINFIKTPTIQEQKAVTAWHTITVMLLCIMCAGIVIMQLRQLQTLYYLHQENKHLGTLSPQNKQLLANHQRLTHQEALYTQQMATISTLSNKNNPLPYLTSIKELCSKGTALETCILTPKTLALTISCPQALAATQFIGKLSQKPQFKHIKMTALQPARTGFVVSIQGTLN